MLCALLGVVFCAVAWWRQYTHDAPAESGDLRPWAWRGVLLALAIGFAVNALLYFEDAHSTPRPLLAWLAF